MIGGSYGGQIQYAVAMQDPRIDAIIPIITWNDLTYSLAPGNVAKKEWVDLFFGAGIISGAQNATADPETLRVCPNFVDQACIGAAALNTAGYPDAGTVALAKHASVASYVKRIKVPTLLVQGQKDTLFNLNEAVATYRSLQAQKHPGEDGLAVVGPLRLHAGPGELDFGAASLRDSYLGNRFLNWMDHYVKGVSSATHRPAVRVLPRLGQVRHQRRKGRDRDRCGVRQEQHGLVGPDQHAVLLRRPRAEGDQGGGHGVVGVLRQRLGPRPRRTPRPRGSRAARSTTSRPTPRAPSSRSPPTRCRLRPTSSAHPR